jgi:hypothetical protein
MPLDTVEDVRCNLSGEVVTVMLGDGCDGKNVGGGLGNGDAGACPSMDVDFPAEPGAGATKSSWSDDCTPRSVNNSAREKKTI